jgi:hypothetical protein
MAAGEHRLDNQPDLVALALDDPFDVGNDRLKSLDKPRGVVGRAFRSQQSSSQAELDQPIKPGGQLESGSRCLQALYCGS